jgi:hypothetical protein
MMLWRKKGNFVERIEFRCRFNENTLTIEAFPQIFGFSGPGSGVWRSSRIRAGFPDPDGNCLGQQQVTDGVEQKMVIKGYDTY